MKLLPFFAGLLNISEATDPWPARADRPELPVNCPKNVQVEICYTMCQSLICWEYPLVHYRRRRSIDEKLAQFSDQQVDCFNSNTVPFCNAKYGIAFDPLA
ncbi:unnamed protein product [Oikopleura dioica]|uniref:Uncharacterized protein n=1 Tax=Oikopleura dioica TaxID=34765 RepID=E4WVD9_OIKDI|nr:unnamed protein product [Oikopleura dioica]